MQVGADCEEGSLKLTQTMLLQRFESEFDTPNGKHRITPARWNLCWSREKPEESLSIERQSIYRSGTGELLHMVKWSRPEC